MPQKIERKKADDGTEMVIVKDQVSGLAGLLELLPVVWRLVLRGWYMRKIRVNGRPGGQRLSVLVVIAQRRDGRIEADQRTEAVSG